MEESIQVRYAHCTKATPGQLDREPWYTYELRVVPCFITKLWDATIEEHVYLVQSESELIASSHSASVAHALAAYNLMNESRAMKERA